MSTQKTWTKTLDATSLVITSAYGFVALSILCTSGTITILGDMTGRVTAPDAITLSSGQGVTIGGGDSSSLILEGITIDASAGIAALIAK